MITRIQPFQAGVPLGGTTGQVLTKASNTDYDYAWSVVTGGVSDGDKGDITVSGSGSTWTIDDGVITFSKIQNINQFELLGRYSASAGSPQVLTLGDNFRIDTSGGIHLSDNTRTTWIDNASNSTVQETVYIVAKGNTNNSAGFLLLGDVLTTTKKSDVYLYGGQRDESTYNGIVELGIDTATGRGFGALTIDYQNSGLIADYQNSAYRSSMYVNFGTHGCSISRKSGHTTYTSSLYSNDYEVTVHDTGILFGNSSPETRPSGVRFEFLSTTGGLRFPLHTTTQRNALANVSGNVLWNSTDLSLDINNGTAWNRVVTSDFLGVKVTVGTTAPSSPAVNDLWVDTN